MAMGQLSRRLTTSTEPGVQLLDRASAIWTVSAYYERDPTGSPTS